MVVMVIDEEWGLQISSEMETFDGRALIYV